MYMKPDYKKIGTLRVNRLVLFFNIGAPEVSGGLMYVPNGQMSSYSPVSSIIIESMMGRVEVTLQIILPDDPRRKFFWSVGGRCYALAVCL